MMIAWQIARRRFATAAPRVFDRALKRRQRDRAAALWPEESRVVDYVRSEVADRVVDRLLVCARADC